GREAVGEMQGGAAEPLRWNSADRLATGKGRERGDHDKGKAVHGGLSCCFHPPLTQSGAVFSPYPGKMPQSARAAAICAIAVRASASTVVPPEGAAGAAAMVHAPP